MPLAANVPELRVEYLERSRRWSVGVYNNPAQRQPPTWMPIDLKRARPGLGSARLQALNDLLMVQLLRCSTGMNRGTPMKRPPLVNERMAWVASCRRTPAAHEELLDFAALVG